MRVCDNCRGDGGDGSITPIVTAVPITDDQVADSLVQPADTLSTPVPRVLFRGELCEVCLASLERQDWSELAKRQPAPVVARPKKQRTPRAVTTAGKVPRFPQKSVAETQVLDVDPEDMADAIDAGILEAPGETGDD